MPDFVPWLGLGIAVLLLGVSWWRASIAVSQARQSAEAVRQQLATVEQEAALRVAQAQAEAQRALDESKTRQKELLLQAQEEKLRVRSDVENEFKEQRIQIQTVEQRIMRKEENLDRKTEALDSRERKIQAREKESEALKAQLESAHQEQQRALEQIAGMTADEAAARLMHQVEQEVAQDVARRARDLEITLKEEADARARKVISIAIARAASDYVPEITVTTVPLPNDEMKGRIIGREGRNIRAIERATGVDLIIDETPESITLSAFDPVRREVARRTLQKLLADGRIHPARVEEVVAKVQQEMDVHIREEGERAAYEANVAGLHPDLIKLLGRLSFRTSYGQNQLHHAIESSRIAAAIAAEIGADINVAKTATLLHDIGKAVDHEVEGPHALIGADIARRLGRSQKIVHAIAAHHSEEEPQTVEAWIVQAADALSGGRPGARRDSVEHYTKRLEALEGVANSFDGVERAYAIQAGREVRIMVKPDRLDDLGAMRLARDIVKKIEESLEYPGQIKVTVIRETRAVDFAK
ncbi:MAG TPA: ribonuclease Y [Chloroflexia bacterium]|nr:ribonuclease Y [Chloroflexia bacterium]